MTGAIDLNHATESEVRVFAYMTGVLLEVAYQERILNRCNKDQLIVLIESHFNPDPADAN